MAKHPDTDYFAAKMIRDMIERLESMSHEEKLDVVRKIEEASPGIIEKFYEHICKENNVEIAADQS